MKIEIINEALQDLFTTPFYRVSEEGYYYSKTLAIFFNITDAIKYWETLAKRKWSKKEYKEYSLNRLGNGFWYYGLDKITPNEDIKILKDMKRLYEEGGSLR